MHTENNDKKKYIFDDQKNVWLVVKALFALCTLLIVGDFFIPKHGDYYWENVPQFFAAYGLVTCILLVLAARFLLRPLVKRKEDHYDK